MARSLPAFLTALALGLALWTPSTQAAPKTHFDSAEAQTLDASAPDKGAWWGFEFIVCVAGQVNTGEPLSDATSVCRVEFTRAQGERTRGDLLQAWWGFEF